MTSPATRSFYLCMKFNTECGQTIKTVNKSQHNPFTHSRGHTSPLADDTKLVVYPECNSAGLNKREERSSLVVPNLWTADPRGITQLLTASRSISRRFVSSVNHFCDKLKVSSCTALLTYQQAVATIQLSAHRV